MEFCGTKPKEFKAELITKQAIERQQVLAEVMQVLETCSTDPKKRGEIRDNILLLANHYIRLSDNLLKAVQDDY